MKYHVNLLRVVEQLGAIEVEAANPHDAEALAMELAKATSKVLKKPSWRPVVHPRQVEVISVEVAA